MQSLCVHVWGVVFGGYARENLAFETEDDGGFVERRVLSDHGQRQTDVAKFFDVHKCDKKEQLTSWVSKPTFIA